MISCIGKTTQRSQNSNVWDHIFRDTSNLDSNMQNLGLSQIVLVGADLECLHARNKAECPFHSDKQLNILIFFNVHGLKEIAPCSNYGPIMELFRTFNVLDELRRTILLTENNIALHFECPTIPALFKIGGRRTCFAISFGDGEEQQLRNVHITYMLQTHQRDDDTIVYTYNFKFPDANFCLPECRFDVLPPEHGRHKIERLDNLVRIVYEKFLIGTETQWSTHSVSKILKQLSMLRATEMWVGCYTSREA